MPNITYNLGIPNQPNNPSVDQPKMKTNNDAADTIWDVDHFGFNDNKGGRHQQVTLTNTVAPGFAEGNGVFYAQLINGQSWPVWQNALGSTQMLSSITNPSAKGYTSLPGSIMIQWGRTTTTGTTTAETFATDFRAATTPLSIVLTVERNTSNIDVAYIEPGTPTNTGFTIRRTFASNLVVDWIAIGLV